MKAENLHSLERTERMMMRWMCGVSLKDRKRSEDLYILLGIQSVAKVVRHGRLRWFGHVERKSEDDWVSACRNEDVDELGLHPEWVVFRDVWRGLISGQTSNPS